LSESDRFTSALLRDDLRRLNSHLPKERRTLAELLKEVAPSVGSVSGHQIKMRKSELEELAHSLPATAQERIRLPLILLRASDLGPGAYTVLGDPYEEYAITILSKQSELDFEGFKRGRTRPSVFYKPEVSQLLRKFHSLVTIGFGTTLPNE
jgi:uncharacterized protein (UPF0216 family)